MTDEQITLPEHEARSEMRYENLMAKIDNSKGNNMATGTGTDAVNIFATPDGGGGMAAAIPAILAASMGNRPDMGSGLGAGLIGGLLGGLVFGGGRGPFGRDDSLGGIPAAAAGDLALMAAIGNLKDTINTATIGVTAQLSEGFATTTTNTLQQTQLLTAQASVNQLMAIQALNTVNQNVSEQGSNTRATVTADGAATRALIAQLNTDNLNRLLTVADLDRRDEVSRGRSREVEVNVAQTVNQVQAQAQQQQQQQQITGLLTHLCGVVGTLQNAVATNSNLIVGNSGATTTGAQTANPVNVRA